MKDLLQELYFEYGEKNPKIHCMNEILNIKTTEGNLKNWLTHNLQKQLLTIIDNENLITCKMSMINFISGIRFGIKLMAELYETSHHIED